MPCSVVVAGVSVRNLSEINYLAFLLDKFLSICGLDLVSSALGSEGHLFEICAVEETGVLRFWRRRKKDMDLRWWIDGSCSMT